MPKDYDFEKVPAESIDDFLDQAKICLDGTIALALAADGRATTLTGTFGAAAIALSVAAATMAEASNAAALVKLIHACVAAAVFLFLASLCCAKASNPADFHIGGFEPRLLADSAGDRTWMLRYVAASIQRRIDSNRESLLASARWVTCGMVLALCAFVAAGLGYVH